MTERDQNEQLLVESRIQELPYIQPDKFHCNGRNKGKRTYCKRTPGWGTSHKETGRCKNCGGNNLSGIAHSNYKGRGYSKDVPSRLMAQYEASLNDPKLLTLRSELALCDAKISELLQSLKSAEASFGTEVPAVALGKALRRSKRAVQRGMDPGAFLNVLDTVEALVKDLISSTRLWEEMGTWIDRRQRLTDSEFRHVMHSHLAISAEEMTVLAGGILRILRDRIDDRKLLGLIADDVGRLIPREENAVEMQVQ